MTLLEKGDHFLAQDCLYGGTHSFVTEDVPKLGIACSAAQAVGFSLAIAGGALLHLSYF